MRRKALDEWGLREAAASAVAAALLTAGSPARTGLGLRRGSPPGILQRTEALLAGGSRGFPGPSMGADRAPIA